MSFILDALKRSERARRVLGAAQPPPPGESGPPPPRHGWIFAVVTALVLINLVLLTWFMLRPAPVTTSDWASTPQGEVRPLSQETGVVVNAAPETSSHAAPIAAPDATPLAEVEPALRARLLPLHVDVHGWADEPSQRFVLINLKRHVAGDQLEGGITLIEIVAEGVIVELDGQRVLLPRQ